MKYFIDSNIFLRVAIRGSEKAFAECVRLLELIESNKIEAVCCSLILSEVSWVLGSTYKVSKSETVRRLRSILNFKDIKWVDKYNLSLALKLYEESNVKFIDAMIASMPKIQSREWVIVSYDRDFDKLKVKRLEPGQVKV